MQPLTTMPAGTLIQMGSQSTHLAREILYYKGPILQKIILGFLGPLIVHHVLSTEQGISDTKLGMWSLPSTFSHCLTWEPQSLDTDTSAPQTQVKGGKHRAFNES